MNLLHFLSRFLVENVKCRWQDQAEITKYLLNVLPLELDAEELSSQSRVCNYWTNLPLPPNLPGIRNAPETSLQHFLQNAIVLFVKIGVSGCRFHEKGTCSSVP